jgi:hypothetical protein
MRCSMRVYHYVCGETSYKPTYGSEQFRGKARFKREPRNKKSHASRIIHVLLSLPQRRPSVSFLRLTVALVMSGLAQKPTLRTHAKVR